MPSSSRKPLRPIRVQKRWERAQIDLTDISKGKQGLQGNHGCRYLLTCVDCFTKKAWVWKLKNKEARKIARCLKKLFKEVGAPDILQSDNGKEFNNQQLTQLIEEMHVKAVHGAPLKPSSQGQIEV